MYSWGSKISIFKTIFAQVQAPRAKMAEKCEKALITIIVIDMLLIEGPESLLQCKKLWIDCGYPHSYTPCGISILITLLTPAPT